MIRFSSLFSVLAMFVSLCHSGLPSVERAIRMLLVGSPEDYQSYIGNSLKMYYQKHSPTSATRRARQSTPRQYERSMIDARYS